MRWKPTRLRNRFPLEIFSRDFFGSCEDFCIFAAEHKRDGSVCVRYSRGLLGVAAWRVSSLQQMPFVVRMFLYPLHCKDKQNNRNNNVINKKMYTKGTVPFVYVLPLVEYENHTRVCIYNLSNLETISSSYACFWSSLRKESFISCCHLGNTL